MREQCGPATGFTHYPLLISGLQQVRRDGDKLFVLTLCMGVYSVPAAEIVKEGATCLECIATQ